MPTNTVLMHSVTHEGDSTQEKIVGDKVPGAGYYGRTSGFHSIQYSVDNFVGTIKIQATLALRPEEEDWFTASEFNLVEPESFDDSTRNDIASFEGNYVWVRCVIVYEQGHVQSVLMRF